mgnify:FL=1
MKEENHLDNVCKAKGAPIKVTINVSDKRYPALKALNVEINVTNFESSDDISKSKEQGPKYNLKIKKRDLVLIDEIANLESISRAELINKLIHDYFLNELSSIEDSEDDKVNNQLRMLFASRADAIAQKMVHPNSQDKLVINPSGWSGEIVKTEEMQALKNYFNYGVFEKDYLFPDYGRINEEEYIENSRSPAYKKLREKLLEK